MQWLDKPRGKCGHQRALTDCSCAALDLLVDSTGIKFSGVGNHLECNHQKRSAYSDYFMISMVRTCLIHRHGFRRRFAKKTVVALSVTTVEKSRGL